MEQSYAKCDAFQQQQQQKWHNFQLRNEVTSVCGFKKLAQQLETEREREKES